MPGMARARTTLGDLQRLSPWIWLNCEKCQHYAPLVCAVPVIRWGPNTSSDKLRQCVPAPRTATRAQLFSIWGGEWRTLAFCRFLSPSGPRAKAADRFVTELIGSSNA
jgi:hypothetical protein